MAVRSLIQRLSSFALLGWLALAGPWVPLGAQSYQTSFSEVKFDRTQGVATFHSNVQIDGATGALSASWPLGPGIGARGLTFRPALNLRWAPQRSVSSSEYSAELGSMMLASSDSDGGGTLFPGRFTLMLDNGPAAQAATVSNWELPDGSSGILAGEVPTSSAANALSIAQAFGFSTSYSLLPTVAPVNYFRIGIQGVNMGSNGELVLFLCNPGSTGQTATYNPSAPDGGQPYFTFTLPDRVLVVKGDLAYEFTLEPGPYAEITTSRVRYSVPAAGPVSYGYTSVTPQYLLSRILNRAGESLTFTYATTTLASGAVQVTGYSAAWTGSSATVTVAQTGTGATITYAGTASANPSYTLTATVNPTSSDGEFWHNLKPTALVDNNSHDSVGFTYGTCAVSNGPIANPLTTLSSITYPNRTLTFIWNAHRFVRNHNTHTWEGYFALPQQAWFSGVEQVSDVDLVTGVARTTTHARTLPDMADFVYSIAPEARTYMYVTSAWTATAFRSVVTHPDGTTSVAVYAPPPTTLDSSGAFGGPASSAADQMQALLNLKHVVVEERTYEPGTYTASDLSLPLEQSVAFHGVRRSQWKLNRLGNPGGTILNGSLPYPGTTETFTRQGGKLLRNSTSLAGTFDTANFGWPTTTAADEVDADPGASVLQAVNRSISSTWQFDATRFFPPRKVSEQVTVTGDTTGSLAPDVALPYSLPATTWAYTDLNRLQTQTLGSGATSLTTTFAYGTSGTAQLLAQNVLLDGTGSDAANPVGIQQYGYDGAGLMNLIQQRGAAWTVQQSHDVFGRPATQTDANGNVVNFTWDASGRLTGIQPTDGSQSTAITYDDDTHRIVTVTRGSESSAYHFNGYGKLIQEIRFGGGGGGGGTSHRLTSYDTMDRPLLQTVWRPGTGSDGANVSGTGFQTTYDGQGRVISTVDPNGRTTVTTYVNAQTTSQTVHGATVTSTATGVPTPNTDLITVAVKDGAGRLVSVTDPKGQATTYRYDPQNRIRQVLQTDAATGVTQTRSWIYDTLGRLVVLDQPESGVTYTTSHTVLGKPRTAVYGLPSGWRPGSVDAQDGSALSVANILATYTTFDGLGRLMGLSSSDGSVTQAFAYDQQTGGDKGAGVFGQSNGKRVYAKDGGVEQWFFHAASTPAGALSRLETRVWSGGAVQSGTSQTFLQTYTYDAYGKRLTATVDGRRVRQTYDDAMQAPVTAFYLNAGLSGGVEQSTVTASYDSTSWQPVNLSWAGSLTAYSYDADQTRVNQITHGNGSGTTSWGYQFDPAGRLLIAGEDSYRVDELGRLVLANVQRLNGRGSVAQAFRYDAFGNQTSSQATGDLPSDTIARANINNWTLTGAELTSLARTNQLPSTANSITTGAIYNAQGNLTGYLKSTTGTNQRPVSLGYDALGRVTSMTDTSLSLAETYAYTADGLRLAIRSYAGSGGALQKTRFNVYNDARQLVSEYLLVPSGTTTASTLAVSRSLTSASATSPAITASITCNGSAGVATGTTVSFSGSFTADCPYTSVTYRWDFGDGTTTSGIQASSVSHTYNTQGVYTVTLQVTPKGQSADCYNTVVPATLVITVVAPPTIGSFTASATALNAGQPLTLAWTTANATSLSISNKGTVTGTSVTWNPSVPGTSPVTTTYILTATNTLNGVTFSVSSAAVPVTVYPNPTAPAIVNFYAGSYRFSATAGGTQLYWQVTPGSVGTLAVTLNGTPVSATSSGYAVNPSVTTTYELVATSTMLNQSTRVTQAITLTVIPPPSFSSFTASNTTVAPGGATTLSWVIQNATSLVLNGLPETSGMVAQGSLVVAPPVTTTYTLAATNEAGTTIRTVTVTVTGTGALCWVRDVVYLGGREVGEYDSAGLHVIQTDHQGSPRFVVNASGVVESQQKTLPFGETLDQTGSLTTAKGYTGHEQTDSSGLIYMQARFYVPGFHRFSSPDPARDQHFEDTQSWNIYSYVRNNPVMMTDPSGMQVPEKPSPKLDANQATQEKLQSDLEKKKKLEEQSAKNKERRVMTAQAGANLATAALKLKAAGVAAAAAETGAGALAAVYLARSAVGNLATGVVQAVGAATGEVKKADIGAKVIASLSTITGTIALITSHGNLNTAATAAAAEGIIACKPSDITHGSMLGKILNTKELVENSREVIQAEKLQEADEKRK